MRSFKTYLGSSALSVGVIATASAAVAHEDPPSCTQQQYASTRGIYDPVIHRQPWDKIRGRFLRGRGRSCSRGWSNSMQSQDIRQSKKSTIPVESSPMQRQRPLPAKIKNSFSATCSANNIGRPASHGCCGLAATHHRGELRLYYSGETGHNHHLGNQAGPP